MPRLALALLAAASLLAGGAVAAAPASADVAWLCRPGDAPEPCVGDLTTTVQAADGSTSVVAPPVDPAPPVDCFYVYPTVSEQAGVSSDKARDPAQVAIATYQAQRYSSRCRVFAPLYRQRTLGGIYGATPAQSRAAADLAYGDVREAFAQYLAQDSGGRGFVLIGHSQGASILRRLVREVVDGDPALRARMVSAILLGGNVAVRRGSDVGGDFQQVPACHATTQLGCVVAWSTYFDDPGTTSRFGRVPATDDGSLPAGTPTGDAYQVLCTNPADLAGNARSALTTLTPTSAYPGIIGAGLRTTFGGTPPTAPTPWVQPADRYTGACVTTNGATVLKLEPVGAARRLEPFPDATWGVHLTDANIALGQLVDLVGTQGAAYVAAQLPRATKGPPACIYYACPPPAPVRPALTVRIRPTTGRKVTTTVALGVPAGTLCSGTARVTLYAGGARLSRRTITLTGCRTAPTLRLAPRRAGRRISAAVTYSGGGGLTAVSGRTGTVRVRR